MANAPEINNPAIRPTPETPEVQPSEVVEKAPSATAQTLAGADTKVRLRDYTQYTTSDDLQTVEVASRGSLKILNSQYTGDTHDGEKDLKEGIALATAAQYRLFEHGGLTRQKSEPPTPASETTEEPASNEPLLQGLKRGRLIV